MEGCTRERDEACNVVTPGVPTRPDGEPDVLSTVRDLVPIVRGHADEGEWSRSIPDALATRFLSFCLRGPAVGSSGAAGK